MIRPIGQRFDGLMEALDDYIHTLHYESGYSEDKIRQYVLAELQYQVSIERIRLVIAKGIPSPYPDWVPE